jgi:hypothetical protein
MVANGAAEMKVRLVRERGHGGGGNVVVLIIRRIAGLAMVGRRRCYFRVDVAVVAVAVAKIVAVLMFLSLVCVCGVAGVEPRFHGIHNLAS